MFETLEWADSPTGARLAFHHQPAATKGRAILLVAHGLAEHSRRYQRFATAMAAKDFHVYAWDHRGHGETSAPDAPIGRFAQTAGAERVVGDVMAMRNLATARHPGLPVLLMGHSMGGLIALNAAIDHPDSFNGLAIWNSNFNPGIAGRAAQALLIAERALKGSDVPSDMLPRLTFQAWGKSIPGHRTLSDWLTHDAAEVDAYIADPLCGFDASVSLWLDVLTLTFRAPPLLGRLERAMPVYLVGGEQDPATRNGSDILWLARRMKQIGLANVTTRILPETRHESLNEAVRDSVTADFADWAETALANTRTLV